MSEKREIKKREFVYDEKSEKSWSEQAGEYNAELIAEWEAQPKEKPQMEIIQETVDMLVISTLGGEDNV